MSGTNKLQQSNVMSNKVTSQVENIHIHIRQHQIKGKTSEILSIDSMFQEHRSTIP